MPVFISAIGGMLLTLTGSIVGRVFIALGLGVVTYTGLSVTTDQLTSLLDQSLSGLPADIVGLLGYMKVGVCINIIISAIAARMLINGISGDTFKRWVLK